jgi:penicillin-binding protein 2
VGLGIDRINTYTRLFGFGTTTNSGIPGEARGLVPSPEWKEETFDGEPWRLGDTYNTTIGQYGFQVTPLQVVRAVGAIANNGYLVTPGLLKIDATTATPRGVELPVSKEHLQIVREGMRLGTQIGTGQALNLPYVSIGVKTGTAELNVDKSGVNSWVTGFFPYENPEYSFAIVLEKGKTGNTVGASYAAQTFFTKLNQDVPLYLRPTP